MNKLMRVAQAIVPLIVCANLLGIAIVMGTIAVWKQERRERRAA